MNDLIFSQAKEIALRVVRGEANANESCVLLADLCHKNGWPNYLVVFSALAHEQSGHEKFGMNAENTAPLIVEACEALIKEPNPINA